MKGFNINLFAQLLITGFDLYYMLQKNNLELEKKTEEALIERLKRANQELKDLPDLREK